MKHGFDQLTAVAVVVLAIVVVGVAVNVVIIVVVIVVVIVIAGAVDLLYQMWTVTANNGQLVQIAFCS